MVEVEKQACDVRAVALRLGEDLLQALVEQRSIGKAGKDVVLRELVRVRRRDLELLRPLRDLVLERSLVGRDFRLRLGEALRHVVERVGEQAELVGGARGHIDVELAGADGTGRAHQASHRRDEATGEEERRSDRDHDEERDDRQRTHDRALELGELALERHAELQVADGAIRRWHRIRGRSAAGRRRRCRPGANGRDQLEVATGSDLELGNRNPVPGGCGNSARKLGHVGVREGFRECPCDDGVAIGIEDARVGDVAFNREAVENGGQIRTVTGHEAVLGGLGEHRHQRRALCLQLGFDDAPFLPDVETGRGEGGHEDQADRQQVELGQQAHPHRRQIERRDRVRGERREMPAQAIHREKGRSARCVRASGMAAACRKEIRIAQDLHRHEAGFVSAPWVCTGLIRPFRGSEAYTVPQGRTRRWPAPLCRFETLNGMRRQSFRSAAAIRAGRSRAPRCPARRRRPSPACRGPRTHRSLPSRDRRTPRRASS